MEAMIQEVANKIWSNSKFQNAAREMELAWLRREVLSEPHKLKNCDASRMMQAAAILACSDELDHRRSAFRTATYTYELFGNHDLPLDQALRVVLVRLGNFPSLATRKEVESSAGLLPLPLAVEEIASADAKTITIDSNELCLTNFQHELWEGLSDRRRIALSAPTSAGKSFVLQNYISSAFSCDAAKCIVYIVPTRALIAQVSNDLLDQFSKLSGEKPEIVTVPLDSDSRIADRSVLVMTQERIQVSLSANELFRPDLIVVDEAHSISEGARGIILQWVIDDLLERNPAAQILFASPIIRNLGVFGNLFGLPDITSLYSSEPTVSQNFLLVDVISSTRGLVNISSIGEGSGDILKVASLEIGQTLASRIDKLVHIPARLGATQSNIIYANGAAEAEKVALQLLDLRMDTEEPTEERLALADLVRESVHPNYALVECVKRGIAFHYSNMPAIVRRSVEEAVSSGAISFLVCTSTLLQGVNLPAKNIFMCKPEKGRGNPLESTDFWNLSGRAGRLRREFQGNIFLLDYKNWKKKPLEGPKDSIVVPAIATSVLEHEKQLINVINDQDRRTSSDEITLETAFVRLFSDYQRGDLNKTLSKLGVLSDSKSYSDVESALLNAVRKVDLPENVIKRTPNISAHKQQRLFDRLQSVVALGRDTARTLIPAHPREVEAFQSYADILELCHDIILGYDTSRGLHRFHAVMALKWMKGLPLPQIIDEQIERSSGQNQQKIIRDTLDLIEREIRFQAVRLIGCYITLLVYCLELADFGDLSLSIPSASLYLEVGASDKTMISLISLGLSRVTAMKLNEISSRKDLDPTQALHWIQSRPLQALGLSPLLLKEVESVIASYPAA